MRSNEKIEKDRNFVLTKQEKCDIICNGDIIINIAYTFGGGCEPYASNLKDT